MVIFVVFNVWSTLVCEAKIASGINVVSGIKLLSGVNLISEVN